MTSVFQDRNYRRPPCQNGPFFLKKVRSDMAPADISGPETQRSFRLPVAAVPGIGIDEPAADSISDLQIQSGNRIRCPISDLKIQIGGIRKPPFCTCHSPHQHNLPIPNSADARRLLENHQNTKYPLYCLGKKKSVPDRSLATVFDEAHMSQTNNGGCGRGGLLLVILPVEPRTLFTATDHNFRAFRIAPVGALP